MTKKIIVLILFTLFSFEAFALDNKHALEVIRAKKLDQVIARVNNMYEFINLYIMETGATPTFAQLTTRYANMNTDSMLEGQSLTFTVSTNIVTFSNILQSASSDLLKGMYKNHASLDPNAHVNTDLTLSIGLKPQTIKFMTYITRIQTLDTNALVSESAPTCTAALNRGRLWYQPDANGGFVISYCQPSWQLLSNKINISIYRDTVVDLNAIKPPTGTIGYALTVNPPPTPDEVNEYVFDGTAWQMVEN